MHKMKSPSMKKVLFILNDLRGGGAERVFVNIANSFFEKNISVAFLLGEKEGVYLHLLNPAISIMQTGSSTFYCYLKSFPSIFKKQQYTHIFTASDYASAAAIFTKKRTGISAKIIVTHHYNLPGNRTFKHWKGDLVANLIHRYLFPGADAIIAVSKGCLVWLKKHSRHELPQAVTIYNPVFDKSIYSDSLERINYPIDTNNKIILVNAGRLEEQKDQLTLLKAFVILKKSNPAFVLFILGDGPLKPQLESYIDEHHLHKDVFLMGFDANPYKWMAGCQVFVSSSISEGFGNVLVEAMALGKTVVSTNCPSGPAEILENGTLGYLCPVRNPSAMAATILKAVNSPLDATLLKEASQQYTIDAIVKKYMAIL